MIFSSWQWKIPTLSLRSIVSAVMVLSVLLGPYSFAGASHAQEHQTHETTGHHDDPVQSDHEGVGHALTHCGSAACGPSFFGIATYLSTHTSIAYRLLLSVGDDALLRSLYLDFDPPVPRDDFSHT